MPKTFVRCLPAVALGVALAACGGPQIRAEPNWTPAVLIVTPTTNPALVQASPTPLNVPTKPYTIKPGETLAQIAQRYGLTVQQLAALNGISNPNHVQAGQEIRVPKRPVHR